MSVNGLGQVAKRCAHPHVRPNGPGHGRVPPICSFKLHRSSIIPSTSSLMTAPCAFRFKAYFVCAFGARCMNVERPAFSCQGGLSGIAQRQDPHTLSAARVPQLANSAVAQGCLCILVPDLCACVQVFALYVYFQSLCSEISQEYLRYPTVTSFIFNYEYMTSGLRSLISTREDTKRAVRRVPGLGESNSMDPKTPRAPRE